MHIHNEAYRKLVHAGLALLFAGIGPLAGPYITALLGAGMLFAFVVGRKIHALTPLYHVPRVSTGEIYFAVGVVVTSLLFLPDHTLSFVVGMLVLAIADPLAALIGRKYGSHIYRAWGDKKSVEGSMACAIASGGILVFAGAPLWVAYCGGLALAFVEAYTPRGGDNVLLPLVAGMLITLV
jgi:phytol kinase